MLIAKLSPTKFKLKKYIEILIPTLAIGIGLLVIKNHVLWRDEMQGWLVAWNSHSLVELWENNAPSGHPVLWSILIYLVKDITKSPLSMQLMHWVLGSASIIIFWGKSPFPNWQKTLFIFGFFPFWEYFIISRHYVIAELLVFVFCSSYNFRKKSYIPASICIGLLTNTQALAWSIAFACGITLLTDWLTNPSQRHEFYKNRFWLYDIICSVTIIVMFSGFGAFSLFQVSDKAGLIATLPFDPHQFLKALGQVLGGYTLIIPNSRRWLDLIICGVIVTLLLSSTLSFLRRSKSGFTFFVSGTGFLFLFNYFLYIGSGARHYGYYFLILISAIWLTIDEYNKTKKDASTRFKPIGNNQSILLPKILTICLSIHLATGIHMVISDFQKPFSAGKATAQYIKAQGWENEIIFGSRDNVVATVSGYLDRELYYPEIGSFGSFAQWDKREPIRQDEVFTKLKLFFNKNQETKRILLVLNRDSAFHNLESGEKLSFENIEIIADKSFENSWHDSERFFIYWASVIK